MSPPPLHPASGALQVLKAARALFGEHGVDAVSIQDIATRAGVSKATVFHHFASKEELYVAVMRDAMADDGSILARHTASTAPFAERLIALLTDQLTEMMRDPEGMMLVTREMCGGNVDRAKLLATQIFADKVRQKVEFFADAQQRGELSPDVVPAQASMLLGACTSFYFNCRESAKHLEAATGMPGLGTPREFAEFMVPLLLNGIRERTALKTTRRRPAKAAVKPTSHPTPSAPVKP
jgi:TetR/AcrR family transcriptional regulator